MKHSFVGFVSNEVRKDVHSRPTKEIVLIEYLFEFIKGNVQSFARARCATTVPTHNVAATLLPPPTGSQCTLVVGCVPDDITSMSNVL